LTSSQPCIVLFTINLLLHYLTLRQLAIVLHNIKSTHYCVIYHQFNSLLYYSTLRQLAIVLPNIKSTHYCIIYHQVNSLLYYLTLRQLAIVQPIAFGVSFHPNLQSQSHWSLFNGTRQKRPRELDHRLRFEIGEPTLQMQQAIISQVKSTRSCMNYH